MNWEYIITPGEIYYTQRKGGENFKIDNQNIIKYGYGDPLEPFNDLFFIENNKKNVGDFFKELWEVIEEKGNFMKFKTKNKEIIYLYNTKFPLQTLDSNGNFTGELDNYFHYAQIFFKDRRKQITDKTEDFCKFLLDNNINEISNAAKLKTLATKDDFIKTMENPLFIKEKLKMVDTKTMEDLFLLWKGCHIWRWWKVYLYAFLEQWTKLIPIYFTGSEATDFEISETIAFDKIDIILFLAKNEKISLLWDKISSNMVLFNEDVLLSTELQEFYNKLISINKDFTKKEIKDIENEKLEE